MSDVLAIILGPLLLAAVLGWGLEGFRNGDRATDVLVKAVLRSSGQPGEDRPVAIATLRNPSGAPVLAALAVRPARRPSWLRAGWADRLAAPVDRSVPRWTRRRRFRADRYPTVGVVPAGAAAEFAVPVTAAAGRYRLTVLVGQADGRLRVHRLRLGIASPHEIPSPGTHLFLQG